MNAAKLERIARIHEIRQWGTTEDAENAAIDIVSSFPDDNLIHVGIFATGVDDDTEEGDGGISFQCVDTHTVIVVEVNATGDIVECHRVDGDTYSETDIDDAKEAATYLMGQP